MHLVDGFAYKGTNFKPKTDDDVGKTGNPLAGPNPSADSLFYRVQFNGTGMVSRGIVFDEDLLSSDVISFSATLFGEIHNRNVNPLGHDIGNAAIGDPSNVGDFVTGLGNNSGDASFSLTFNNPIPEPVTGGLGLIGLSSLLGFATKRRRLA